MVGVQNVDHRNLLVVVPVALLDLFLNALTHWDEYT
jgi:hypothetical protein